MPISPELILALPIFSSGIVLYRYYDIDVVRADLPHLQTYYSRLQIMLGFFHHVVASYNEIRVTTS